MDLSKLPPRKNHETPRLVISDAYTTGSNIFESEKAKEKSIYYITFRKRPHDFDPTLYAKDDQRYVFYGLQRILDKFLYEPVTHAEIDEAMRFLADKKITMKGLTRYQCPEAIWRSVVDDYGGRIPISIRALKQGSVFYPNEPIVQIESLVKGMGVLAAWLESKLLQIWAPCQKVTQNEHWLLYNKSMVRKVYKTAPDEQIDFLARLMLIDFGDRAGITWHESEVLGEAHLLTFPGTDTFCGAYQAWKNADEATGIAMTVSALAHRNVQSYEFEKDCYEAMYNAAEDNEMLSQVADCYSFYDSIENNQLKLAQRSQATGVNKIIIGRPDSDDALQQVTWLCRLAKRNGLYKEQIIDGTTWFFPTTLKFISANEMTWPVMMKINDALLEQGFPPFAWGTYGQGGGGRNGLRRDDPSAKYALCAYGEKLIPACKFSETIGKTTLPGPFKLRRDQESLNKKQTIAFNFESGEDVLIEYYYGLDIENPFREGQYDNFIDTKNWIKQQMLSMPKNLESDENHNYPATDNILEKRRELLRKYAPKKLVKNY